MEVTSKAKENGPRYAAPTVQNAAAAVERKGQKTGKGVELVKRERACRAAFNGYFAHVTLRTLARAAHAIGRDLRIELV